MAKKLKFDETGDSDDLQALFDSIASGPAVARVEVVAPVAAATASVAAGDGDNDELQALFDSVADQFTPEPATVVGVPQPEASSSAAAARGEAGYEAVFQRIGQMTRQVHDTLRELGYDEALQEAASAIPDARQRLSYIAQLTEQAASRVLNATDIARPIQDRIEADAEALRVRWDRLYANQLSVEEFKQLSAESREFMGKVAEGSRATNAQLLEIMMAQDFQDLTGQVIKKVIDMAQALESQLLQVLIEVAPSDRISDKHAGLMNGPVISAEGRDDVVTSQEQVDDLLESLGF
jgi:chemotaxis protein CheZ